MTVFAQCTAREDKNSRAAEHRLGEPTTLSLGIGCIPAEPASLSPGEVIVALPPVHRSQLPGLARQSGA
jgi:hypothetical protein